MATVLLLNANSRGKVMSNKYVQDNENNLLRVVGVKGAVMMGMGSIIGTGVFVSLGLAAGLTGPAMVLALLLAGCLAICNGLSTAQLAASHPVSGGTYEYGHKYVGPWLGYIAGWLFVCAKSASAATAAIGFGGYCARVFQISEVAPWQIGLIATSVIISITALGIKRSNMTNIVIVSVTLVVLLMFVVTSIPMMKIANFAPFFENFTGDRFTLGGFFEAAALMFVAYTGYGRVATLGEEIEEPIKNIPKAIVATLTISFVIYMLVAVVSVGSVGAEKFYMATIKEAAPLEVVSKQIGHHWIAVFLSIGAMTAMLGVLLNLVLGLSRVIFAMGRKGDLPKNFGTVQPNTKTPLVGVVASGVVISALIFMKDVKATWSFSAFTVLFYYAITNISALNLPPEKRLYPRAFAWIGLLGCLSLSLWVNQSALMLGGLLLLVGISWRLCFKKLSRT
jgi:APA family basic amino acid/polyamine antiporter